MVKSSDTSQTLGRGLDVLALVAASAEGITPAQIAAELGLSRTIVYRLIGTLVDHRMVRRNAHGLLSAGLGTLSLSQNLSATLRMGTREILEGLAEELGATAHLSVADGDEALAVAVVEPRNTTFHLSYRVDSRTPIEKGALGQALLAAREGRSGIFESEGQLIPGAKGLVAALPLDESLAACVGVVTLAAIDTSTWAPKVLAAADQIQKLLA
jgi:IclR helix-turn-helix domain